MGLTKMAACLSKLALQREDYYTECYLVAGAVSALLLIRRRSMTPSKLRLCRSQAGAEADIASQS